MRRSGIIYPSLIFLLTLPIEAAIFHRSDILLLTLAGFAIGLLSGMFGFGGSSISTPILRIFFSIPPYLALASPLPMTLFSSTAASVRYHRERAIRWDMALKLLIFMIPGSILGAFSTAYISGKMLMLLTALFLIYISVVFITGRKPVSLSKNRMDPYILGFSVGILSGMLGNGGGIFVVPILVFLGLELKKAIPTSLAIVIMGVLPAIIVHAYLGHIDWYISLALTAGAIPASYIGAEITIGLSDERTKKAYGAFLLAFSAYFAILELI